MVPASTRRLPWTSIELTDCATAALAPAPDKVAAEEHASERKSPNNPHTKSHALRALLSLRLHPDRNQEGSRAGFRALYSVLADLQTKVPPQLPLSPQKVAAQQRLRSGEVENVIKGCKNHQHDDDRQPNPEADFLGALGQRPAAGGLDSIEQKVTPIEQGEREEAQEPDRHRQHRRQVDQGDKADRRNLP